MAKNVFYSETLFNKSEFNPFMSVNVEYYSQGRALSNDERSGRYACPQKMHGRKWKSMQLGGEELEALDGRRIRKTPQRW